MSASHTTPTKKKASKGGAKKERLAIVPGSAWSTPQLRAGSPNVWPARWATSSCCSPSTCRRAWWPLPSPSDLDVMAELMEADVTEVAGPKASHNATRAAYRHGHERASDHDGRPVHPTPRAPPWFESRVRPERAPYHPAGHLRTGDARRGLAPSCVTSSQGCSRSCTPVIRCMLSALGRAQRWQ